MYKSGTRISFLAVLVATAAALSVFALPAGATSKTATFCKDLRGVTAIPSPGLPNSDSFSAIASAVSKLPDDVTALKKIHIKLIAAVAAAPNPVLAGELRVAVGSVAKESTAITGVMSEEVAVFANPKSSSNVIALARDLIAATSAAATANAYLAVGHPMVTEACK